MPKRTTTTIQQKLALAREEVKKQRQRLSDLKKRKQREENDRSKRDAAESAKVFWRIREEYWKADPMARLEDLKWLDSRLVDPAERALFGLPVSKEVPNDVDRATGGTEPTEPGAVPVPIVDAMPVAGQGGQPLGDPTDPFDGATGDDGPDIRSRDARKG